MATHKLAILVTAIGAEKAAKNLKGVDKSLASIGSRAGKGLRTAGDNLRTLGIGAAGLAAAGLVGAVKAAGDFEAQLQTINTVAGLTDEKLKAVGEGIRGLARDTGSSLSDLTGAYYDLVSAGIKPGADALKVLTLANTLAIGGLGTTAETVDLLTTAINTYHLSSAGAAKATDMFAEAIALGKVTASQLAESFAIIGPLAKSAGVGIDEISAGYATLTAKGVPAAEAATEMRSALVALMKVTPALATAQKKLGVNFADIAKRKGLVPALQMIRDYSDKTGVPMVKLLGRIEGVNFALSTTGANAKDYADALQKVRAATGVAADQMSERQKGLNYELTRLKALAIDAGISLGSKLLPKLTPLAEKAVKFLETHQSDIDAFGNGIASAFDKAAAFAEKVPWGTIGKGLQTAAEWSGKLMDAFLSMPADVQTTLIALAGLNKLSGGAITGVVSELGKGLIKGVLGMTAGVVNLNAAVVNGGGAAGGAADLAGNVAKGGLLATLGTAAIVAAGAVGAAYAFSQLHHGADAGPGAPTLDPGANAFAPGKVDASGLFKGFDWVKYGKEMGTGFKESVIRPLGEHAGAPATGTATPTGGLTGGGGPGRGADTSKVVTASIANLQHGAVTAVDGTTAAVNTGKDAVVASQGIAQGFVSGAVRTSGGQVANTTARGASNITTQSIGNASRIVGAISANRPIVNTSVAVYVTGAAVTKSQKTQTTYGPGSGSAGNDSGRIGGR